MSCHPVSLRHVACNGHFLNCQMSERGPAPRDTFQCKLVKELTSNLQCNVRTANRWQQQCSAALLGCAHYTDMQKRQNTKPPIVQLTIFAIAAFLAQTNSATGKMCPILVHTNRCNAHPCNVPCGHYHPRDNEHTNLQILIQHAFFEAMPFQICSHQDGARMVMPQHQTKPSNKTFLNVSFTPDSIPRCLDQT